MRSRHVLLETDRVPDVLLLEPLVHRDSRGFFLESFNLDSFSEATGLEPRFVQSNHSRSGKDVLRGLHYQVERPQAKLVRVARGAVFDVAVDLRRSSDTYGKWLGAELTDENHRQMWIPEGFAHGFVVLSDLADVLYETTAYYQPDLDRAMRWSDPDIGIEWPLDDRAPILSVKDRDAPFLSQAETFD